MTIFNEKEFLIVNHGVLNNPDYDVEKLVKKSLSFKKYLNGKVVVPCIEGDLIPVRETGELILSHSNFSKITSQKYEELKKMGIATSFEAALDKITKYKKLHPNQRIVICIELKPITDEESIRKAILIIKKKKIKDVYFDSFYGGRLDVVDRLNKKLGTNFEKKFACLF